MKNSLSALTAIALLTGCAGGVQSSMTPQQSPQGPAAIARDLSGIPLYHAAMQESVYRNAVLHSSTAGIHWPPLGAAQAKHQPVIYLGDDSGYIWIVDKTGKTVLGDFTDCAGAEGLAVDKSGDLWAACTNSSTINEYKPGATSASLVLADTVNGIPYYPGAVTVDGKGNVYVSNLYGLGGSPQTQYPGNVAYWKASDICSNCDPSGVATEPNLGSTAEVYFIASDPKGDVFITYDANDGAGLDEIVDPQSTSDTVTTIVAPSSGTLAFPAGVAISEKGKYLNALNTITGDILRWSLPTLKQEKSLGPLPQNNTNSCIGTGINFAKGDKTIGAATTCGLALGKVASNKFTDYPNIDYQMLVGVAFDPSDGY